MQTYKTKLYKNPIGQHMHLIFLSLEIKMQIFIQILSSLLKQQKQKYVTCRIYLFTQIHNTQVSISISSSMCVGVFNHQPNPSCCPLQDCPLYQRQWSINTILTVYSLSCTVKIIGVNNIRSSHTHHFLQTIVDVKVSRLHVELHATTLHVQSFFFECGVH